MQEGTRAHAHAHECSCVTRTCMRMHASARTVRTLLNDHRIWSPPHRPIAIHLCCSTHTACIPMDQRHSQCLGNAASGQARSYRARLASQPRREAPRHTPSEHPAHSIALRLPCADKDRGGSKRASGSGKEEGGRLTLAMARQRPGGRIPVGYNRLGARPYRRSRCSNHARALRRATKQRCSSL
jgi:hypothetical protein